MRATNTFARARAVGAEILLTIALLGGWALVTWGVALLTTWKVWAISAGLLLLSCGGWKLLWVIVTDGLYAPTRVKRRG
jgi:protein-S-isoprenylcysteine O-methyltransferase Ste14